MECLFLYRRRGESVLVSFFSSFLDSRDRNLSC